MRKGDEICIGRLAFRVEGEWWTVYLAQNDTMDGAIKLGSILLATTSNPEVRSTFMSLMRPLLKEIVEELGGEMEEWIESPAPEHERAGSA